MDTVVLVHMSLMLLDFKWEMSDENEYLSIQQQSKNHMVLSVDA